MHYIYSMYIYMYYVMLCYIQGNKINYGLGMWVSKYNIMSLLEWNRMQCCLATHAQMCKVNGLVAKQDEKKPIQTHTHTNENKNIYKRKIKIKQKNVYT